MSEGEPIPAFSELWGQDKITAWQLWNYLRVQRKSLGSSDRDQGEEPTSLGCLGEASLKRFTQEMTPEGLEGRERKTEPEDKDMSVSWGFQ